MDKNIQTDAPSISTNTQYGALLFGFVLCVFSVWLAWNFENFVPAIAQYMAGIISFDFAEILVLFFVLFFFCFLFPVISGMWHIASSIHSGIPSIIGCIIMLIASGFVFVMYFFALVRLPNQENYAMWYIFSIAILLVLSTIAIMWFFKATFK